MSRIYLAIILVISIWVRLVDLSILPPALFADEVDAGVQARTFVQNQTDYFGNRFPIHFQSFSDWRTSLYIYSIAIFEKLNFSPELAIRLPSVIFGVLSVYIFYLLTSSLPATFLLAISPWAIHYSRTGFEVMGMILCILAGAFFWKKYSSTKNHWHLITSTTFFVLTPYFYSTAKLFLLFIFPICYYIWKPQPKHLLSIFPIALLLLLPLTIDTIKGRAGFRFSYIGIFTEPHREQITDTLRYQDVLKDHYGEVGVQTSAISTILHNKYQLVAERFIKNYLSTFSPNFLFLGGDSNVRQGFGAHGLLYTIDFFLILFGLHQGLKKKSPLDKLFILVLILGPIPFALTRDSIGPHATRLIIILPSLLYFASLTLQKIPTLSVAYLLLFFNFWHYYQHHYPQTSARAWHANLKESVIATVPYQEHKMYFSNTVEPFLPFFLYYFPYKINGSIENHLSSNETSYFNGQCLDNHYCFGNLNMSEFSKISDPSIIIAPSGTTPPANFHLVKSITKKYIESAEFNIYSNTL